MSALMSRSAGGHGDLAMIRALPHGNHQHSGRKAVKPQTRSGCSVGFRGRGLWPQKVAEKNIGVTSIGREKNTVLSQIQLGEAVYHLETEYLVTGRGDEVLLRSQSSIVLQHLAKNLGAIVPRDDLIAMVWPDIAVTDDSLTQCISDIRKALGDRNRTILKTVPKRGYILRGEPVAIDTTDPAAATFGIAGFRNAIVRKIALAISAPAGSQQVLVGGLPAALRPETLRNTASGTFVLIYTDPGQALQAALDIAKSADIAIAVDYTDGEGLEAETLLQVAKNGAVLTSPDISAMLASGHGFDFHDLGEVVAPQGRDKLRPFRVTKHSGHQTIVPQLDARDILPTLAILPFQSQANGADMVLGTFLADEVSTALGQSEDVNVISRLSTISVSQQSGGLQDIGRLLNADFVLSGVLIQKDNRAIAIIEFAETETQFVLWSDRIELTIDPMLREIEGVEHIVAHIRKAITLNEVRRVRSQPLDTLKLFSVLHGAVGLMHRMSLKEFQLARSYLEYVISKAPNHPAPLAWLARWHVLRTVQGWT